MTDSGADGDLGVAALRDSLDARRLSSVELTTASLKRIGELDPAVHALVALDPSAQDQAASSDRRRAASAALGILDGIPILVKDNIDTAGLASTAGSRLLTGCPPRADSPVVARLRASGAVILGKTNLSEWSNFRSTRSTEGWSAIAGQTRNPHALDRSPWGSSAGSAVAVATGMAVLALGTETDGSVVCPAGANGVVGVKPEHGLLPLAGVVPISRAQDTVGVFAARLDDAAIGLAAMTGRADLRAVPVPLAGRRLGVWRAPGMGDEASGLLDDACAALRAAHVTLLPVNPRLPRDDVLAGDRAFFAEFGPDLEEYLRSRDGAPQSLPELIAANAADPIELSLFGQDIFESAAAMSQAERELARSAGGRARQRAKRILDAVLRGAQIDAILALTNGPAWLIDHAHGDRVPATSSTPAAMAGYPSISLPAGFCDELPIGISIFGPSALVQLLPIALATERIWKSLRQQ